MTSYATNLLKFRPTEKELKSFATSNRGTALIKLFDRPLIWRGVLEKAFEGESCTALLASMHCKILECWALLPFGLEYAAYSNLRGVVDTSIAFSYYARHPVEWEAVVTGIAPWIQRSEAVDTHTRFTPNFKEASRGLGLIERLNSDYAILSKYVHGIPPEGLGGMTSFTRNPIDDERWESFLATATRSLDDLSLLLVLVFPDLLTDLGRAEYKRLLTGIAVKDLARFGVVLPQPS